MGQFHKQVAPNPARLHEVRLPSKEYMRASGQVQSLSRALKIMNALSYQAQGMSLSEVAHEVGLPTSTAHRLLTTLQNERFVRFDPERSTWLVGMQAFRVGSAFLRSRDVAATARPFMRRLMEQSGETVNLAIADRGEIVFLAQVECNKVMRAITGPGGRTMMHCSGVGKALLAFGRSAEVEKHLKLIDFRRETSSTVTSIEGLRKDLAATLARGYAVDNEENAIGLRCVAGPVFDEHGDAIAGLSVSGPAARIPESRIPALGAAVAAVANEITQELGGHGPQAF